MQPIWASTVSQNASHLRTAELDRFKLAIKQMTSRRAAKGMLRSGGTINEACELAGSALDAYFDSLFAIVSRLQDTMAVDFVPRLCEAIDDELGHLRKALEGGVVECAVKFGIPGQAAEPVSQLRSSFDRKHAAFLSRLSMLRFTG